MDKTAIKTFAINSRKKLMEDVEYKMSLVGINKEKINEPISSANGIETYQIGGSTNTIYDKDIAKRKQLVKEVNEKGFENVVEEVAYTWFNRIIAIRFMEINNFLPTKTRVLSSETPGKIEPDIITEAFDVVGMYDETEKFYTTFCQMTQSNNGMWEQRFYTDGRLAPCWGYQIDETASVIYGIYAHYQVTKNKKFLKDNLEMCEKAVNFLEKYIEDLLEQKGKFQLSYDLWEEFEGVTLYSLSTIYAAFKAMLKIYAEVKSVLDTNKLKHEKHIELIQKRINDIKEYCLNTFYDDDKKSFVRNTVDRKIDISSLGAIVPFGMVSPKEKIVQNTIERINMTLRTYTGGYIRYENDGYMGGYNPWPIATLWMAWYYLEAGDENRALENFAFVVNSASSHGFLGEQVNNDAMKPNWVIGLTWSHAMFLLILDKLLEKGLL